MKNNLLFIFLLIFMPNIVICQNDTLYYCSKNKGFKNRNYFTLNKSVRYSRHDFLLKSNLYSNFNYFFYCVVKNDTSNIIYNLIVDDSANFMEISKMQEDNFLFYIQNDTFYLKEYNFDCEIGIIKKIKCELFDFCLMPDYFIPYGLDNVSSGILNFENVSLRYKGNRILLSNNKLINCILFEDTISIGINLFKLRKIYFDSKTLNIILKKNIIFFNKKNKFINNKHKIGNETVKIIYKNDILKNAKKAKKNEKWKPLVKRLHITPKPLRDKLKTKRSPPYSSYYYRYYYY